ncbi:MAG: glyoxal or galactose oxidase [Parcubacteria group bacterium Greene0714_36]|nr:MAG: glyoxal or galactose oxidase [Parcubacteria group bacterium Greene0714_36]
MTRIYTKDQLQERYEKLPDALKDAIFSTEIADKIFETGKKNGLTVEKIGFLAEETGRVILGLTRPNEFVGLLAERLGTNTDAAQKIASDVNHQIFFPLREVLKSTHQVDVGEAVIPRSAVAPLPIDLRKNSLTTEPQRPPLVDIGGLNVPPSRPSNFLSREEVEKVVAEKRIVPPPAPKPAPLPSVPVLPQKVPPMDLRKTVVPQLSTSSPQPPRPPSTPLPQSSPQAVPLPKLPAVEGMIPVSAVPYPRVPLPTLPVVERMEPAPAAPAAEQKVIPTAERSKIPPIDLRKDMEVKMEFMPPPPMTPRPAMQTPEQSKPLWNNNYEAISSATIHHD